MHFGSGFISWQGISLIGLILVEVSYLPQILRLYRVKEAHEFHVLYPTLNVMGRLIVLVGGIFLHRQDITWGMAIGVLVRLTLLSQVFYYRAMEERDRRLSLEQVSV